MIKLEDFGYYRIYRHSKEIIEQVLKDFFKNLDKQVEYRMPTIKFFEYNEVSGQSKIDIYRDWWEKVRKVPFLIVSILSFSEKILQAERSPAQYLGVEDYIISQTSTGFARIGIAADMQLKITIGAEDSDARMDLIDLLFSYFTLHAKQMMWFRSPDFLHDFYFTVPNKPIERGAEAEVPVGRGTATRIYAAEINVPAFIQANYKLQLRDITETIQYEGRILTSLS